MTIQRDKHLSPPPPSMDIVVVVASFVGIIAGYLTAFMVTYYMVYLYFICKAITALLILDRRIPSRGELREMWMGTGQYRYIDEVSVMVARVWPCMFLHWFISGVVLMLIAATFTTVGSAYFSAAFTLGAKLLGYSQEDLVDATRQLSER